jgi:hypothetical protein
MRNMEAVDAAVPEPLVTNRQIEDAALAYVISQEAVEGRKATDMRTSRG